MTERERVSSDVGLTLCVLCMFCWGVWPYLRMQCKLEGPAFSLIYFTGQSLSSLTLALLIGGGKTLAADFNSQPRDSWRVVCIVLGGGCVGNADFLCSLAMSRVHFSVAFPIYTGFALALGSSLVFSIDKRGDPSLLFSGVLLAILAICSLAAAEAEPEPEPELLVAAQISPLHLHDDALAQEQQEIRKVVTGTVAPRPVVSRRWVWLCAFCGLVGGLWSPLSTLGRLEGGVESPLVSLIIFQLGQLSSTPLQCSYYSLVLRAMEGAAFDVSAFSDPMVFLHEIHASFKKSYRDVCIGLCTGGIVGIGWTLYFISSSSINATVALAIPSCEPLVTIILGVLISRKLDGATLRIKCYYTLAFSLFIAAIALMAVSL